MALKDRLQNLKGNRPEGLSEGATNPIPEFYANTIVVKVSPFEFEVQNLLAAQRQGSGESTLFAADGMDAL